jgi:hypothetical protein
LFPGTNLLAMNVAPCGSAMTAIRTQGASNGGTITAPPSSIAFAAVASASSTAKVTFQCAGVSGWSSVIGLIVATDVLEPVRRARRGHLLPEVGVVALEVIAVAGQRPHLSPGDVERPPAEDRAVERPRAFDVAGVEAVEVQ